MMRGNDFVWVDVNEVSAPEQPGNYRWMDGDLKEKAVWKYDL